MLYTYDEIIKIYNNDYKIKKAVKNQEIFKIKKGIYSTIANPKEIDVFHKEYKNYIFTMESAFYYLGISDNIPSQYVIATERNETKYNKQNIKQLYYDVSYLNVGKIEYSYNGSIINIYNKERMLIELIRYKNKIPYDYYKEIINYYRNNILNIDISLLSEYVDLMPKKKMILKTIQMEVL